MISKHRRFCQEYIIDHNGKEAAVRVGFAPLSAAVSACRLLMRDDIQDYVAELHDEQSKRLEISADKVLEQYRRLAFADVSEYFYKVYELRYFSSSVDKTLRKRDRLQRRYGSVISEDKYDAMPTRYKSFYQADEVLKPLDTLTKEQRAAIQGITYDKNGNAILKLSNKENSLDALAKHLGIFEKDNKQKATNIKVENRSLDDFYITEGDSDDE